MELDDLKASWRALDQRVTELTAMNRRLVIDNQKRKVRWRLLPVFISAVLSIAVGGWLVATFARFWIAHLDTPSAVIAGVVLHVASLGVVIAGVVQLLLVTRINYAKPVVTIQRYLALLQAWEARTFYWTWLSFCLGYPAMVVAVAMVVAKVDLWARAPGLVLMNVAFGVVGALVSVAFHRYARSHGTKISAWIDRFLRSHSVARARQAIDEIDRFARE